MGKVVLVGAGPGDPQLLTLKGKEYVAKADCIVYDRLAGDEILEFAREDCRCIYVGKEKHYHIMEQDKINALLLGMAEQYSLVVRLKGGDPYVFGRGGEEALFLTEHGVEIEVVPGISSSIAAPMVAGIPVTHRGIARSFRVITAHGKNDIATDLKEETLSDREETLVFLMGLGHIEGITEKLVAAGRSPQTPAAVISNATVSGQKKCVGTISTIAQQAREQGLLSPAVIIVGDVVGLQEQLSFSYKRPLIGKTYFIPCIKSGWFSFQNGWIYKEQNELVNSLRELGAKVITYHTGAIVPVSCDMEMLAGLTENDYLVFTSQNAVHAFMWNLKRLDMDIRCLGKTKIAVVGKKTEQALRLFGMIPFLVSDKQRAMALAQSLERFVTPVTKVLWFCAKEAEEGLTERLLEKCQFEKLVCYENIKENQPVEETKRREIGGCDGVFFTSGSNVKRTVAVMGDRLPEMVYSIGASCSAVLRKEGVKTYREAAVSSYEGLIELVWKKV